MNIYLYLFLILYMFVQDQVTPVSCKNDNSSDTVLAVSYLSKLERMEVSSGHTSPLIKDNESNDFLVSVGLEERHRRLIYSTTNQSKQSRMYCLKISETEDPVIITSKEPGEIMGMSVADDEVILIRRDVSGLFRHRLDAQGSCSLKKTGEIELPKVPSSVAQDACSGRVFWSNSYPDAAIHVLLPQDESQTIISTDLYHPKYLLFNEYDHRLYWIDVHGGRWKIESSLWDGDNRRTLLKGQTQKPFSLAADGANLYWTDWHTRSVWTVEIPRDTDGLSNVEPKSVWKAPEGHPLGVTVLYPVLPKEKRCSKASVRYEETEEINTATILKSPAKLVQSSTEKQASCGAFCVNGSCVKVGASACLCNPGFTGPDCSIASGACDDYCVTGECHFSEGLPTCKCPRGFVGDRCERGLCHNWCLNNGSCSIHEDVAMCTCWPGYRGLRCELLIWEASSPLYSCRSYVGISNPFLWSTVVLGCVSFVLAILLYFMRARSGICRAPKMKTRIIPVKTKSSKNIPREPKDIEECCNFNVCDTPCDVVIAKTGSKKEDHIQLLNNGFDY